MIRYTNNALEMENCIMMVLNQKGIAIFVERDTPRERCNQSESRSYDIIVTVRSSRNHFIALLHIADVIRDNSY